MNLFHQEIFDKRKQYISKGVLDKRKQYVSNNVAGKSLTEFVNCWYKTFEISKDST